MNLEADRNADQRDDQRDGQKITVGEIRGVFGVQGWVKLFSFTDPRDNLLRYKNFATPDGRTLKLLECSRQGKTLIGKLEGVVDRDAALAVHGTRLAVARAELPSLEADEFYWSDLLGLTVRTTADKRLGVVDHLLETGAHDVLVIRDDAGHETLVPFVVGKTVISVDLDQRQIVVDWIGMDDGAETD